MWHGQAKIERAVASNDPLVHGYWASLVTPTLIDALYAIRDVPLPSWLPSTPPPRQVAIG
jgi:hypothetical protein